MTVVLDKDLPGAPDLDGRPVVTAGAQQRKGDRVGLVVAALVVVFGIGFVPIFNIPSWTIRMALLPLVAAAGLPWLPTVRRSGQRLAVSAASAFAVIALVTAVVSPRPLVGLTGDYGWGTGAIFVAGLVGIWALGASSSPGWSRHIQTALLAVASLNAVVALAQLAIPDILPALEVDGGRAPGLTGNPVHLAALLMGAVALCASRASTRTAWWAGGAALLTAAAQLTGSRFVLVVVVIVAVAQFRPNGVKTGSMVAAALLAGVLAGTALASGPVGSAVSSADRVGTRGVAIRLDIWGAGGQAVAANPLGHGPGQFRDAVAPYGTPEIAAALAPNELPADAHNIVIEYAVTTGLAGVMALMLWIGAALFAARGPLAWFALALLGFHLVQPQSVITTPLLFLALGAAAATLKRDERRPLSRRVASALLLVVAGAAAAAFVVGDYHLHRARLDFDRSSAVTAERLIGHWAQPAHELGKIEVFEAITSKSYDFDSALGWLTSAAASDPGDPSSWVALGMLELADGRHVEASIHLNEALRTYPWWMPALMGMAEVEAAQGHHSEALMWAERAAAVRATPEALALVERLRSSG
ncbi:MAG: O-antigen ligase family protein [Acidimicrobiia bacterium]|nr:O-antigen ligase family protein [Acidimicrobiia bacterium]